MAKQTKTRVKVNTKTAVLTAIAFVAGASLMFGVSAYQAANKVLGNYIMGDLNGDNVVNEYDLLLYKMIGKNYQIKGDVNDVADLKNRFNELFSINDSNGDNQITDPDVIAYAQQVLGTYSIANKVLTHPDLEIIISNMIGKNVSIRSNSPIVSKGDINKDGKLNILDVALLSQMSIGKMPADLATGDMDNDGQILNNDIVLLKNKINQLDNALKNIKERYKIR